VALLLSFVMLRRNLGSGIKNLFAEGVSLCHLRTCSQVVPCLDPEVGGYKLGNACSIILASTGF
jgi:hypothetical protein